MSSTCLVVGFFFFQQTLCEKAVTTLRSKNWALEDAVNDLLNLLQDNILFKDEEPDFASSVESEEEATSGGSASEYFHHS